MRDANRKAMFAKQNANNFYKDIKKGIKAPYVSGGSSSLGSDDRTSILFAVSADKKDSWSGGYLENSKYGKFHLLNDGTLEQFSGTFRPYLRKSRIKNPEDASRKINALLEKQK